MNTIKSCHQILLASRPKGMPSLSDFKFTKIDIPPIQEGEVLIASLYLSVDPYMRGRMGGRPSSHPPFELNQCLNGKGIGKIIDSKSNKFKKNDIVIGYLQWADYSIANENSLKKLDSSIPITAALGALGSPGMTAYFGLLDIGKPKPGETIVISGAAGAVGMMVGQIAKIHDCRVVAITGTDAKAEFLIKELKFDAAINYKNPEFKESLSNACFRGIDIYFDNVGGNVTDIALSLINKYARIVLCGQISTYNFEEPDIGLRHFRTLIVKSAKAQGIIVHDYKDQFPDAIIQIQQWINQGQIKCIETITHGLENVPKAFLGLFTGENIGKQLVQVES